MLDDATAQITLRVRSTQATAPCPLCTTSARRIHSHYARTLADLPWAHYRVRLQLRVRKWFCPNTSCKRRIFTERLPTIAAPWAWRTLRLAQRLVALGIALGGKAGVRLGHQWDLAVSRNTLRRLLRRAPRQRSSAWMTLHCGNATLMARSWWIWSAGSPRPCSRSARPSRSRSGCASTPAWR